MSELRMMYGAPAFPRQQSDLKEQQRRLAELLRGTPVTKGELTAAIAAVDAKLAILTAAVQGIARDLNKSKRRRAKR